MNINENPNSSPKPQEAGTYSKVQKHLSDINDVISEDDIRNVKIELHPANDDEPVVGDGEDDEEIEEEHEEAKKVNSSWNVIGE